MNEYDVKILPDELLSSYFNNECTSEDKYIIQQLMDYENNRDKFEHFKTVYADKTLTEDLQNTKIIPFAFIKNEKTKSPQAGEIWILKRVLPPIGFDFIEPVAQERLVFILSEPLPFYNDEGFETDNPEYFNFLCLPVSLDVEFATHHEYLVESNNDILGVPFMIATDYAFNVTISQLQKYIGRPNDTQIDEIVNMHFYEYGGEFEQEIYEGANKGNYFDDDFGNKYDYKRILIDNFSDIAIYNAELENMFEAVTIDKNMSTYLSNPILSMAASDGKALDNKEVSINLIDNDYHTIILIVNELGKLKLKVKHFNKIVNGSVELIIKEINEEIIYQKEIDLRKRIVETELDFNPDKKEVVFLIDYEGINLFTKVINFGFKEEDNEI